MVYYSIVAGISFVIGVVAGMVSGYVLGRFKKSKLVSGDICIAIDHEDGTKYPFMRLNGELESIEKLDFAEFKVTVIK